jgi:hypothetical protein
MPRPSDGGLRLLADDAGAGCGPVGLVAFPVNGHFSPNRGSLAETKEAISRTCAGGSA